MSGDGSAATTVLQRGPLRHSQVSEYIAGSSVSFPALLLYTKIIVVRNLKNLKSYLPQSKFVEIFFARSNT